MCGFDGVPQGSDRPKALRRAEAQGQHLASGSLLIRHPSYGPEHSISATPGWRWLASLEFSKNGL